MLFTCSELPACSPDVLLTGKQPDEVADESKPPGKVSKVGEPSEKVGKVGRDGSSAVTLCKGVCLFNHSSTLLLDWF